MRQKQQESENSGGRESNGWHGGLWGRSDIVRSHPDRRAAPSVGPGPPLNNVIGKVDAVSVIDSIELF